MKILVEIQNEIEDPQQGKETNYFFNEINNKNSEIKPISLFNMVFNKFCDFIAFNLRVGSDFYDLAE